MMSVSLVILCMFGLFVVSFGQMGYQQESSPEEEHYYLCYTYAFCMSDGAEYSKVLECSNLAEPQDQTSLLNYIKKGNYYFFENTNWEDIIAEYCEIDPSKRSQVFDKSLKGAINYYMDKCASPTGQQECARWGNVLDCLAPYLDQLDAEGKCKIE